MKALSDESRFLRRRGGFTMVELLVVISIIALVIAIIMPAYTKIQNDVVRKKVRSMIAALEAGCLQYKSDTCGGGVLPPSGSANLMKYLTGKGMPNEVPTGGFQMVKGGRIYGPYLDVDAMIIRSSNGGLVFKDSYGADIAYYVADTSSGSKVFKSGVAPAPSIGDPTNYCRRTTSDPFPVDFYCASPGPNTKYGPNAWDTKDGDDIVTFVSEE